MNPTNLFIGIDVAKAQLDIALRPGDKIVWCGQNSTGSVEVMNAARKIGATAVPRNYRLSDEELEIWRSAVHRHGAAALRVTAIQKYRQL